MAGSAEMANGAQTLVCLQFRLMFRPWTSRRHSKFKFILQGSSKLGHLCCWVASCEMQLVAVWCWTIAKLKKHFFPRLSTEEGKAILFNDEERRKSRFLDCLRQFVCKRKNSFPFWDFQQITDEGITILSSEDESSPSENSPETKTKLHNATHNNWF
jgi:hypothetical protein